MRLSAILITLLTFFSLSFSQTLRPNHWLEQEIRFLQNRGYLWSLSPLHGPYDISHVRSAMQKLPQGNEFREFSNTLLVRWPQACNTGYVLGQWQSAYRNERQSRYFHSRERFGGGAQLNDWLHTAATVYVDNRLDEKASYMGKRQGGQAAFFEQAYALALFKNFQVKFGRDLLVWGPGFEASLLISGNSRPMDHLYFSWNNDWLEFSFFSATLNPTFFKVNEQPATQHRLLSGHRIECHPLPFLYFAISETSLSGGPDTGLDFAYLNPFMFYHAANLNGPNTANSMGSVDVAAMPLRQWTTYGSFLLDDVQIENSVPADREPAQIGYLAGTNVADPFGIFGVDVFTEYTRVTNRTYKGQGGPWEKYLHRNQPIGHFLGNDFDRLLGGISYHPIPNYFVRFVYEHRRQGEGRLDTPFDTPWLDIPEGESYSEPFPTGTVERSEVFSFLTRWRPAWWFGCEFMVRFWSIDNYRNQPDADKDFWDIRLLFNFEFLQDYSLKLKH